MEHAYVMFVDIKNYSQLKEGQLRGFKDVVLSGMAEIFAPFQSHISIVNTWGDAVFLVFKTAGVVRAILELREFFRRKETFLDSGLPALAVRIGCHYGNFLRFKDPVTGANNAIGGHINTAARIEPVTRPDEIFVTDSFVGAFRDDPDPEKPGDIEFDELGELELAKGFGKRVLCVMRRTSEDRNVIDRLTRITLEQALPDAEPLGSAEAAELAGYRALPGAALEVLLRSQSGERSSEFWFEAARICKGKRLYKGALDLIGRLELESIPCDGIQVFPYRGNVELSKLKANCLTRLGRYEEAGNILYSLWKSGVKDADTLSMLAAQYKRRALREEDGWLEHSNRELLQRSFHLYAAAFHRDLSNYYPAINAAYLGVMLGGNHEGRGRDLARYVWDSWKGDFGKDWWISSTLAECHLVNARYSKSIELIQEALQRCKPEAFEVESTLEQVEIFSRHKQEPRLQDFLAPLQQYLDG